MQEDKIRHNRRVNAISVLLRGTAMVDFMAPSPSHADQRPKNKRPSYNIRHGITVAVMVYLPEYWTQYFSGRLRQQQRLAAAMERGEVLELTQIEINKNDNTKFTPLPVDTCELYCTTVMFDRFVCALLSFCARKFPAKSETREPGKLSWNAPRI